ncbi:kinase-like domain-containing protein [Lyophyllum atratum]|nr:kinase-like domain-containing protein [Lyophyllum atratum]
MNPDILALVARLLVVVGNVELYKKLLAFRGSEAQQLLDSFQWLLDTPELDSVSRRNLIVATQRLSTKSGLYPACYQLKDVVQESQDPISAGGFADIYKADFEGQKVCMKLLRIYQNRALEHFLKQFAKEVILWGQLSHPNVLPIYGLFRFRGSVCFVSPWMKEGDINEYLKRAPQADRPRLAMDVAEGLSYLHENGIIHGDLKGPNVLISDIGRAYLADFGVSSISDSAIPAWTSHSSVASKGGSARWQAPELFDMEDDEAMSNTKASDVYAWSCVCYEAGEIPFSKVPRDTTVMLQVKLGARPKRPSDSSPSWNQWGLTPVMWTLMQECWAEHPLERPTMRQVIERLSLEWPHYELLSATGTTLSPSTFRKRMRQPMNILVVNTIFEGLLKSQDYDVTLRAEEKLEEDARTDVDTVCSILPSLDASTHYLSNGRASISRVTRCVALFFFFAQTLDLWS